MEASQLSAEDLCLDVFVYPQGATLLLDEEDFAALNLPPAEAQKARQAVAEIQRLVAERAATPSTKLHSPIVGAAL